MMTLPKRLLILLILGVTLSSWCYTQEQPPVKKSIITETIDGQEYYLHFVKKGETLFAIARAYGITTNDIFRSNPGSNQGVTDGQILKIPKEDMQQTAEDTPETKEDTYFYHIVKKQETLYGISKKYGVTIDDIKLLNPKLGDYPREGETLKIPVIHDDMGLIESEWEGTTVTHTVVQGETLYSIAKNYNVTIGEIKNANPGLNEVLSIGSTLLIPNQTQEVAEEESDIEMAQPGFTIHEVLQGETLYGIARTYAVSIDTLKNYNPGLTSAISPGQQITIPPREEDTEYILHKTNKTVTLSGISQMYDVELEELSEINPDVRKKVKKGKSVRIPVDPPEEEIVVNHAEESSEDSAEPESHCFDTGTHKNNVYNIALMLPLFLEETDSIDFGNRIDYETLSKLVSFRFVNFYTGFKMALDSMVQQGMKVNLFVYDVDNNIRKAEEVVYASELSSMDLIVGPFYLAPFRKVADFANTYGIPIVNPLSRREELVYNNPAVYKLKPSEEQQIDLLVRHLQKRYPKANIVLLRNNKYKYQREISHIRNSLNSHRSPYVYLSNQSVYEACSELDRGQTMLTENKVIDPAFYKEHLTDSTHFSNLVREVIYVDDTLVGLKMNLSKIRPNVVVAISDEIVFSKEILSQMNKLNMDHDITLFGLPAWNDYTDLETSHLLNLRLHTFTPTLVNYKNERIEQWILRYRDLFHTEPTTANYAFDGFDAGWYFLNALYHYGRDFGSCLQYMSIPLLQTRFQFEKTPGNGYQNIYWNLGVYDDYQYRKVYLQKE